MSIEKALKAKNSGVFIENLQRAFLKKTPVEILDAVYKAPALKWAPVVEIQKLGLMSWCDHKYTFELKSKIVECIESGEFRDAMFGCMYLFGVGDTTAAIDLSEKIFEATESSSDYAFHASSALSVLISCSVPWEGAPNGKCYVSVDKNYLSSTISSIVDDFRQSSELLNQNYIVEFASGYSRANQIEKSKALISEYLNIISDYSELEALIYNFTKTIEGMAIKERSFDSVDCDFIDVDFVKFCIAKAKEISNKSDKDSLQELLEYVQEY